MTPERQKRQAQAHHQAGRLVDAERGYRKVLQRNPTDLHVCYLLGSLLLQTGRFADAAALLAKVVQVRPDVAPARSALGRALFELGQPEQAETHLQQAVTADPKLADGWYGLGLCHQQQGNIAAAAAAFARAESIQPDNILFVVSLAIMLRDLGQTDRAVALFERAHKAAPDNPSILLNLADTLRHGGNLQAAETCYDDALSRWPELLPARTKKAELLEQRGDAEAAYDMVADLLSGRADPGAVLVLASVAKKLGRVDQAVERVERCLSEGAGDLSVSLHFQAGKLYDGLGEYDRAFDHYRRGNDLSGKGEGIRFNRERYRAYTDALIAAFSPAVMADAPEGSGSDLPVFIVGMPRSGTSLTEQILASHPQVAGAGELPDINHLVVGLNGGSVPYPQNVPDLSGATLAAMADRYLAVLKGIGPQARRVTDKMPTNFRHVGLMARLFPSAPMIHCTRHPVDTCLSIYFQQFARGHDYATDLADLGFVYREYRRLMAHWERSLPLFTCRYERTVAEQETVSRELLAYVGLPWDDACLKFHQTGRTVATASYDQVRQPIYRRSVARWRHYERHLGPLLDALGDAMADEA